MKREFDANKAMAPRPLTPEQQEILRKLGM